ncbi:hypothetical protein HMPREF9442_02748 [Paraprevotella xylaniphila YIT 11841]|uniref:Uncharacterized protein n=1 Tax=Paraprevotella xylaniphila YIT 11841 TaxID=762982 RepID=F3QX14_9BACT|nr:hypothetical protein HMPREF9442_02748 [Paraprevotella xylaniphila YIT 11841]
MANTKVGRKAKRAFPVSVVFSAFTVVISVESRVYRFCPTGWGRVRREMGQVGRCVNITKIRMPLAEGSESISGD